MNEYLMVFSGSYFQIRDSLSFSHDNFYKRYSDGYSLITLLRKLDKKKSFINYIIRFPIIDISYF